MSTENSRAGGGERHFRFDVGINDRVDWGTALGIGLQNILGLAGLLLFPGIIGVSFQLSPLDTAYMYSITFITSGVVVILQSVGLLRLPVVQAPFAGIFAAILVVGHQHSLGVAFGSLFIASVIWCILAIPVKHFSFVGWLSQHISLPLVSGVILMVIATQLGTIVLPAWIGKPGNSAFPWINISCAAIAFGVVLISTMTHSRLIRRGAILWGVIISSIVYTMLTSTTWHNVAHAHAFSAPRFLPFGFGVDGPAVIIFFIAWFPAISESIATYNMVCTWADEPLPPNRIAQGIFGEVVGSTVGALFGGMSAMAYPDNVGLLRVTRVASRWVTLTSGIMLVVLGGFGYFDSLLVAIPQPVLAGATTILFGLLFAGGMQVLSQGEWSHDRLLVAGVPFIAAIGLLFTSAEVTAKLPSWLSLFLGQPMVTSTILSLIGVTILGVKERRSGKAREEAEVAPAMAG